MNKLEDDEITDENLSDNEIKALAERKRISSIIHSRIVIFCFSENLALF